MFEVKVDQVNLESGPSIHVVRDDLLGGGTKERACRPFLESLMRDGAREFVYASPFCGFAQVALAKSAKELGARCTIFAEEAPAGGAHEFTELARSYGAKIRLTSNLSEASIQAQAAERDAHTFREMFPDGSMFTHRASVINIPLGFDHRAFHQAFHVALQDAWSQISYLDLKRIWLPVGSGTLARCFRSIAPPRIEINLVDVGVLPQKDDRIRMLTDLPNTRYMKAPEKFIEEAVEMPPIPSNKHYDAKLWAFLNENARSGDLWWNVAR